MTYYLVRSAVGSAANYTPGSEVQFPPAGKEAPKIEVKDPRGTVVQAETAKDAPDAFFAGTSYAGIYEWNQTGGGGRGGSFVVNPDTVESDLARISHEEIEREILKGRTVLFAKDAKEAAAAARRIREGIALQNAILLIVVVVLVAECFLANRKPTQPASPIPTVSSPASAS